MTALAAAALLLSLVLGGCMRPLHRRTYVFAIAGEGGHDHPADLPEEAIRLALVGRVDDADARKLPRVMARAFRTLRPSEVIYYRRPAGGAWLFFVDDGDLVAKPRGIAAATGRYPLAELTRAAGTRRTGPPKTTEVADVGRTVSGKAELEVESAFAVEQFVFLNGTFTGAVPPGETRVFVVPAGKAEIVVADAQDGTTNAVRVAATIGAGRRTKLSVMPQL